MFFLQRVKMSLTRLVSNKSAVRVLSFFGLLYRLWKGTAAEILAVILPSNSKLGDSPVAKTLSMCSSPLEFNSHLVFNFSLF
jgi:hypothetical protein